MRSYSDNDATGNNQATNFVNRTRRVTQQEGQLYSGVGVKIQDTTQGRRIKVVRSPSPPGGIVLQYPLELDPTVYVAAGTVVYISPNNPLATTGMFDLGGANPGGYTMSRPGTWLCVQDVPPQVVNPDGFPDGTYYNVPQAILPGQPGEVEGDPLTGDADNTRVFWLPQGGVAPC